MAFAEDLAPFFDTAGFAQAVTLAGEPVLGIFDAAYADAFDAIALRGPRLTLPTAAAGAATGGTTCVVGGVSYRVTSVQPDGTGVTTLLLELA
jgi:hypothetical protein